MATNSEFIPPFHQHNIYLLYHYKNFKIYEVLWRNKNLQKWLKNNKIKRSNNRANFDGKDELIPNSKQFYQRGYFSCKWLYFTNYNLRTTWIQFVKELLHESNVPDEILLWEIDESTDVIYFTTFTAFTWTVRRTSWPHVKIDHLPRKVRQRKSKPHRITKTAQQG